MWWLCLNEGHVHLLLLLSDEASESNASACCVGFAAQQYLWGAALPDAVGRP